MSNETRIPGDLSERVLAWLEKLTTWSTEEITTANDLRDQLKAQLHPPREPRVGDVKMSGSGVAWVRTASKGSHPWTALSNGTATTDATLINLRTLFNLLDELKARDAGPVVVHLTEEEAKYAARIDACPPLAVCGAIRTALAEYRERKGEQE